MRTACIELAKYGITVNAVMPGNIITEGLAGLGEDYHEDHGGLDPAEAPRHGRGHRLRRALPRLQGGGYITGQTIIVDGGQIVPESLEALASA